MQFKSPESVEEVVWQMRLADYPRGLNRSKINDLFNGFPPYTADEVKANNIAINVNFLEAAKMAHDARRQFTNAFLNPDPLFFVSVDSGPVWKRRDWGDRITKEITRIMKGSLPYTETLRNGFAQDVLHGIGPSVWKDKYRWCPNSRGIEDILVPSNTLVDLENLPFLAVFEQYTGAQLYRLTHGPQVDPGWNMGQVNAAIKWVDAETRKLMSSSWPEVWSPEKMDERIKQDGGLYASDAVPTIDCWRFFYWNDEKKQSGWTQKVILDAWGQPGVGGAAAMNRGKVSEKYGLTKDSGGFLYDSGSRKFGDKLQNIIHFQFADCSSVAPFRYHSVRSLGFLLYSVCHLQNRLRCKFNEAAFENLMQYFRVKGMQDAERAMKIDLTDKRALPDGVEFVRQEERWQINQGLAQMTMETNRQTMADNSSSFSQDMDFARQQEETATRTMAKVNAGAAMVSAMLNQAYTYQKFQYDEICRRFCIKNSRDGEVREFRVNCVKHGVPEELLNPALWNVQPNRVIGSGNKMLQVAMMDKVMAIYTKLDPSAQQEAKRQYIAVNTDDYELAKRWVPDQPHISDSVHDAQLAAGILLQGLPMALKEGVNHTEYIEALLISMTVKVQQIDQRKGIATPDEIIGLQNIAGESVQGQPIKGNGILNHLEILAEDERQPHQRGQAPDKSVKEMVKRYSDTLAQLMNKVKQFAQNAAEAAQKQQQGNGGVDPETAVKLKGKMLIDQAKAQNMRDSHAERTAQRRVTFEQGLTQKAQQHQQKLAIEDATAAQEVKKNGRMKAFQE